MAKLYLTIVLSFLCFFDIYAQKLNVESFVAKTNDITARTQPRQDINGKDCALVKVRLAAENASFSGNVVGDVVYDKSEYYVYMPHGSKRLTIKLDGYLPLDVSFVDYGINSLEEKTVYVLTLSGVTGTHQLEAPKTKTGWIILDSEPSGASVYINDEFVGNTPLSNYKQAYGTYQYRLESPNYHPATGSIDLNSGRYEQKVVLKPAFGSISVKSNIAGAKIVLDGKQTGKQTPTTLTEIPSGTHTITLQMDKYAPRQQEVIVEDGQTANVSMALDARFAVITINSLDGAEIYSNGKLLGKSRISDDMMEGYYDIEARLDHHKSVNKQIQVVAGQSQNITLNPIPKYGSLDIISEPHNATITIDGKEIGKTPFTIDKLLEGEHTVTISKEGYSIYKKVVKITEDNIITVSATIEKVMSSAGKTLIPIPGKAQIDINEEEASIIVSGRLTDEDWRELKDLCKIKVIKNVDLSNAECSSIPDYAFKDCRDVTSIAIPQSVTYIGKYAFSHCGIESITIPNRVTRIEEYTFESCDRLTSITIPSSVTTIANNAFYFCHMTSITIPNSVTTIGDSAFGYCQSLSSITIPNSVLKIGEGAFGNCYNLTSITITNRLTNIGESAFRSCSQLTVYVPKGSVSRFDKNKIKAMRIVEMNERKSRF